MCLDISSTLFESSYSVSISVTNDSSNLVDSNDYLGYFWEEAPITYFTNEWQSYLSHINQKFLGGINEFRDKLKKYVIESSFEFRYAKNHKDKVVAECSKKSESCDWKVRAKKMKASDFFYIKWFIKEHTCKSVLREQTSKHLSSNLKSHQRDIDV